MGCKYAWLGVVLINKMGGDCIKGKFLPYKLIEICAYVVCIWIYNSFKGVTNKIRILLKFLFACL